MCGRYYVDDDTAKEIEKVIRQQVFMSGTPKRKNINFGDPIQRRCLWRDA